MLDFQLSHQISRFPYQKGCRERSQGQVICKSDHQRCSGFLRE